MRHRHLLCVTAAVIGTLAAVPAWLPANQPPIGDLETPPDGATVFGPTSVSGWALDFEDATLLLRAYVDGLYVGSALYPAGDRPDVQAAYPGIPHSLQTGFVYALDTTAYQDGEHQISVIAEDPGALTSTIGLNTVVFDNTNGMIARPWPSTTNGVHVFNDQLAGYMTDAQFQFSATHYSGCQKMLRYDADKLRLINANFLILHYRLGLGLGYRMPNAQGEPVGPYLEIIEGNTWVREWPTTVQDEWFFPYAGSPRVYQHQWGWYVIEPDNGPWRTYWLGEVTRQLQANDDDGLFADSVSVPNYLGGGSFTPALPDYDPGFESDWSGKIGRWITNVKNGLGSGYKLIPNVGYWVTTRDITNYSGADGVMIEGFAEWGEGDPFELADWQLQMDRILGLAAAGRIVIAQSYINDANNISHRMWLLANYLLTKGAASFINMDMGMDPEWFPEYSVYVGAYVGGVPSSISQLYRSDWGVYVRQYANGLALVNPGSSSRLVNLGQTYQRVVPHGGGLVPEDADVNTWYLSYDPVTSITLPAYSGAVLVSSGPSPGVLTVSPESGLASSGAQGGPFSPSSASYTLANAGGQSLDWTATRLANWVTISPASGSLAGGGSTTVTVSINSNANSLTPGSYADTVSLTNTTSGLGNTTRPVQLDVAAAGGTMSVSPVTNLSSSGPMGGPFAPDRLQYTVGNTGGQAIDFTLTHSIGSNWLTVFHTLAGGQSMPVTMLVNSLAASLTPGTYNDTVTFTNLTNGLGNTTRTAQLTVLGAALSVTPADGLTSSGRQGGPFTPSSKQYTLTNTGGASMNWTASRTTNWVSLSPASGTLAAGGSTTVTVSINSNANTLPGGVYTDTVSLTNTTSGIGNTTRGVNLTVQTGSLQVAPADGLSSSGAPGGPFSPGSRQYTLSNPGNSSIDFAITHNPAVDWITISPTSGTLAAGASTTATVTINSNANALPIGNYSDTVAFANTTNGVGNTTRPVSLAIAARSLSSVEVVPNAATVPSNDPRQLHAFAYFTDSSSLDITSVGTWTSSKTSVATVSAAGVVSPKAAGSATISCSYSYGGVTRSGACGLTVAYQRVMFVYVSPSSYTFYQPGTAQLTCKAKMLSGSWISVTQICEWSTSNPAVATVSPFGLVTPVAYGDATISATYMYNGTAMRSSSGIKVRF